MLSSATLIPPGDRNAWLEELAENDSKLDHERAGHYTKGETCMRRSILLSYAKVGYREIVEWCRRARCLVAAVANLHMANAAAGYDED